MLRLRRFDREGLATYVDEVRPRFLTLRLHTDTFSFRWLIPLWVLEELLRFVLRFGPLLLQLAPARARRRLDAAGFDLATFPAAELHTILQTIASTEGRDLLRLPPGEPFIYIETHDVVLEIGQL